MNIVTTLTDIPPRDGRPKNFSPKKPTISARLETVTVNKAQRSCIQWGRNGGAKP